MDAEKDQQLATRRAAGVSMIQTPQDLATTINQWRERQANIISPLTHSVSPFAPGYVLSYSVITLDPQVNEDGIGGDTYFSKGFMKAPNGINAGDAQRALNKTALRKISFAGGITWTQNTRRTDNRTIANYWEYSAEAEIVTPDGQYVTLPASIEFDLRNGSPQIAGMSERQLMQARRFGLAHAESRAKNRAIRELGLKQVYTVDELRKPFIVIRAVYIPDTTDPEIRRMVAARALAGRQALYPHSLPPMARPVEESVEGDVIDAQASTHASSRSETSTASAASAAVKAEPEPLRVTKVEEKKGSSQKGAWTLWLVSFSDGRKAATFQVSIAALAQQMLADKSAADPVIEPGTKDGTFKLTELRRARDLKTEPPLDFGDLPDDAF